jgi:hypothetical protein
MLAVIFAGQSSARTSTMKKYLTEGHFGLLFGVTAFIYFLYTGLTREKIKSEDDLTEVHGKFLNYSFKDNTGRRRQGHEYYIWIDSYQNAFQIKADYLGIFKGVEFITTVRRGDDIQFTIPKFQTNKLNSDENVFVTSIKVKRTTYLSKDKTLEIEKGVASSYADFFLAGGFLVVGLVVYIRKR